ncbi:tripartite tricarboxylate transporter substrate binding protein [Siccirubricoccus sp. G192]|uniref:Bug family tripartite tricarboxylate transporter substrate binding protein n=1 Tax=Siccirubricoccus sp. G192 TaxID=2849651 RepID=UPI001C2B828B|nr:tripartite tricarboxylate transporter substrate-binding protein [Siccirubricoccus sp. G192]MBV1796717.1 tripartite tricarboxylate transporter substrate binding protein [Siccirubricoccus sp. G192]
MPKRLLAAASLLLASLLATPAPAQPTTGFPTRALRVIVPYPAGGASDIVARVMAQAAPEGISVVVENRGGGASIPGTQAVATAAPDGYTLGVIDTALVINPGLFGSRLPYDTERDLAPVGQIATTPLVFVLHPAVPATTLQEWLALARGQAGRVNLGHAGNGTAIHLANAQLLIAGGLDAVVAAYRGGGPLITALLGGEVQGGFLSIPAARPHVEARRLRALAVTAAGRSPSLPEVPGFAEAGLPGVDAMPLFGVVAPAGTPPAILARLHAILVQPARQPEVAARLRGLGYEVAASGPQEFAATIHAEIGKWREVISRAGIAPD